MIQELGENRGKRRKTVHRDRYGYLRIISSHTMPQSASSRSRAGSWTIFVRNLSDKRRESGSLRVVDPQILIH